MKFDRIIPQGRQGRPSISNLYFPKNANSKKEETKRPGVPGRPGSKKQWLKLKNAVHFIK